MHNSWFNKTLTCLSAIGKCRPKNKIKVELIEFPKALFACSSKGIPIAIHFNDVIGLGV